MGQNNPCYLFGMYEPDTDSVIVNAINNTYTGTPLTISCEKCNSTVNSNPRIPFVTQDSLFVNENPVL